MKLLQQIACLLTIVGAINWGLVGAFDVNVVHSLFGTMPMVEKWTYIVIGIAGLAHAIFGAREMKYF